MAGSITADSSKWVEMGEETREDEAEGEEDLDDDPDDDEDDDEGEEWSWPGGIDRRLSIMV